MEKSEAPSDCINRFEYFEIIVRLGKVKFYDLGVTKSY
jgi:hypothetical protein